MPFSVHDILEKQNDLICVKKNDPVLTAFREMIAHDYSQLPVVDENNAPLGMVTHESILRAIKNFNTKIDTLHVRDVMVSAHKFYTEDNLFDMLNQLKNTNAVLIVDPDEKLKGIVTSYDSTEYFRKQSEDLMVVEDIENSIKVFILAAYTDAENNRDNDALADAIAKTSVPEDKHNPKIKNFEQLTLGEYINLMFYPKTWDRLVPILGISKDALRNNLDRVRITRCTEPLRVDRKRKGPHFLRQASTLIGSPSGFQLYPLIIIKVNVLVN